MRIAEEHKRKPFETAEEHFARLRKDWRDDLSLYDMKRIVRMSSMLDDLSRVPDGPIKRILDRLITGE